MKRIWKNSLVIILAATLFAVFAGQPLWAAERSMQLAIPGCSA
ncbi:MAG: hypothetical protein PHY31_03250 [Smithellaceae bacterium]|nr:hypothetical protein [Smithellaceae bacterium]